MIALFLYFGINLFASPLSWLLMIGAAGALAAWTRRYWVGAGLMALALPVLYHPAIIIRSTAIYLLFVLLGLAVGVSGWALRQRRYRVAALGALWGAASLDLFYLYVLTHQPHDTSDLIFPVALLVTLLVLGSLTVTSLPPDERADRQVPPPA